MVVSNVIAFKFVDMFNFKKMLIVQERQTVLFSATQTTKVCQLLLLSP
jgi:hypothetical protein